MAVTRSMAMQSEPMINMRSTSSSTQSPTKEQRPDRSHRPPTKRVVKPTLTNGHMSGTHEYSVKSSPKATVIAKAAQAPALSNHTDRSPVAEIKPPTAQANTKAATSKVSVPTAANPGNNNRIGKTWPANIGHARITGLNNPAMWCYRRSLQQALFSVPQFFNVLTKHTAHSRNDNCVSCALLQSVQSYQTGAKDVHRRIAALDSAIRATGKRSDPSWAAVSQTQEDAHDFLQYLLGTAEKAAGVPNSSFRDSFHVAHQSVWSCHRCGKKHTHVDPASYSISLPIVSAKGTATLASCMDRFHKEENLEIRCDGCKNGRNEKRTRIKRIQHPPEALFIHLMRFRFIPGMRRGTKNNKYVDFPEILDLSPWCLDPKHVAKYKLQAVVAHSGGLGTGHYKAYVRSSDGNIKEANDETVRKVANNEWRQPKGFDPYILLYIKQ